MNTAEIHTLEHLGATFLRNHEEWSDKIIYFGPMGCRTGFYLLLAGDYESEDIISLNRSRHLFAVTEIKSTKFIFVFIKIVSKEKHRTVQNTIIKHYGRIIRN